MKRVQLEGLADEGVSHNPEIRKRVMLRKGDIPHLTGFARASFEPGQIATRHRHADMAEVFLVDSGEGVIRVDGVPHRLAAGVCVAVEPGEAHEVENTGEAPLVLTYFGIEVAGAS